MPRHKVVLALVIFILLGASLRLNNLASRSLWTDEFFTLFDSTGHGSIQAFLDSFSRDDSPPLFKAKDFKAFLKKDPAKGIRDVNSALVKEDTHPPLYFWLIYFWIKLFGDSALAIRLFSVLAGLICIYLIYKVSLCLFNQDVAVSSALFLAISPFAVRYSQDARSYALIMAITLGSSLAILSLEKQNRICALICFAVLNLLGLFAHYFYIFILLAYFLYFTFAYGRDSSLRTRFYLASLIPLLFFFVWFMALRLNQYNFKLVQWPFGHQVPLLTRLFDILRDILSYFLVYNEGGPWRYLTAAGWIIFIYILTKTYKGIICGYRRQLFFCLSVLAVPVICLFFLDLIQKGILLKQERFWVFSFLGFLPLGGYILAQGLFRHKVLAFLLVASLLISSLWIPRKDFGPAPQYLSGLINRQAQDTPCAVIVLNKKCIVVAQAYYLDDDIYLVPVAGRRQMERGVEMLSGLAQKVFIMRHFHPADPSLMNEPFMDAPDVISGLRLKRKVETDFISASEYINEDYQRKI